MTYQVLARKWRPRNFSEMVGQEHVLRALVNALDNNRLHHAFLFTGTRGVGKTTIARILAKSLNCEKGVSSGPCGECGACIEIDEGRFVDLLEVDAASRTKVDDTRELLENVQYAPTRGRYKVYLVDEVHMLSNHSFNALLKTLEEPPPHVKFLLATTDPKKLPVTILSRCLQFNLKRLTVGMIHTQLEKITAAEKVAADKEALQLIATAADGSMRDALSLLDQAIPFGGGELREADVRAMLGSIDSGFSLEVLNALAENDGNALLNAVGRIEQHTGNYLGAVDEVIAALHKVSVQQLVPMETDQLRDDRELLTLCDKMSPEDVQLFYQIAVTGRRELTFLADGKVGLEMLLLRMLAFRPEPGPGGPGEPTPRVRQGQEPTASGSPTPAGQGQDWQSLVSQLDLRGAARELVSNCEMLDRRDNTIRLRLGKEHEHLFSDAMVSRVESSLEKCYGGKWRLEMEVGEVETETPARVAKRERDEKVEKARAALESDPNVKALKEAFGAELQGDSVRPTD